MLLLLEQLALLLYMSTVDPTTQSTQINNLIKRITTSKPILVQYMLKMPINELETLIQDIIQKLKPKQLEHLQKLLLHQLLHLNPKLHQLLCININKLEQPQLSRLRLKQLQQILSLPQLQPILLSQLQQQQQLNYLQIENE